MSLAHIDALEVETPGARRAKQSAELSEFASSVIDALDQVRKTGPLQSIVFPPYPVLLQRLQAAMADAEPDLNEVARIASSDVSMSMALIKAANSPLYAVAGPVQTIGQAMNLLGLDQTAAVMTGFLAQKAIQINSPHLARFWERASKRAVAMSYMAARIAGMSADVAYTCGLFSHAGIPVMLQSCKGYSGTMVEALARKDRSYIATENANHRTDHAVVGALVSRLWRLHPHVTAAIRMHHDLDALSGTRVDSDIQNLMACLLVAEHLMRDNEGMEPDKDWLTHGERALGWLELPAEELANWQLEICDLFDQM